MQDFLTDGVERLMLVARDCGLPLRVGPTLNPRLSDVEA